MSSTSVPNLERRWAVDVTKCVECGDCTVICPASVFTVSPPPCQTACPINSDVVGYVSMIKLIGRQRLDEALTSIRWVNPFPATTGRVCTRPCEKECSRAEIDEPVSIQALERFAGDYRRNSKKWKPNRIQATGERVAIAGSGPAGLMAAYDLTMLGYQVTIFESQPVAGGMLYLGIPEYRLPKDIVRAEIAEIQNLGVEIRLNAMVGKDVKLAALFEKGYRAVLLATGAHKSLKMQIPGEDQFEGVVDAISFLREVNLGKKQKIAGKAVVVGGGNAAIDSARTLLRLGCQEVNIVYRRARKEMPAIESQVTEAEREGAKIHYLLAPTKVLGVGKRVRGLECIQTKLGEIDANGRRRPIAITGSEFSIEADMVISAIGQNPDLSFLSDNDRLGVSDEGLIIADVDTMATTRPAIFAAGDNVTGPTMVIDALAAGKKAAVSIDRYLRGQELKRGNGARVEAKVDTEKRIWWEEIAKGEQQKMPRRPMEECLLSFGEVELGMTQALAIEEARRCLGCAYFAHMDLESCCRESCRICERHCWQRAIVAY